MYMWQKLLTYHCYCDLCCIVRFILGESILLSLPCESKPQCEPVKKTREWSAIHHHLIYTSLYPAPSSFHPHKPTWLLCHNYHKSGFVKLKLMHSIYVYTEQDKKKKKQQQHLASSTLPPSRKKEKHTIKNFLHVRNRENNPRLALFCSYK